jgi:hypothetical protein
MKVEVGTFWKYRAPWSKTLHELVEDKPEMHGVIMQVTHNGRTGNCFCSYLYLKNNLVQVSIDDVTADHPIL